MKRVVLEIDDKYADALTFTVIGCDGFDTYTTIAACDLSETDRIVVRNDGKTEMRMTLEVSDD